MKRVLLLGGAGFIGYSLCNRLLERGGYELTVADNFSRAGGKEDEHVGKLRAGGVKIVEGDFTNRESFERLETDYDQVFMLASVVGVDIVNKIPNEVIRINTSLILNTLEWLKAGSCKKVLFTSTSECYAGAVEAFGYKVPTDEAVPLTIQEIGHPRFTYAVTKMLGESGFLNYSRAIGFECSIVRYHNVYGPRMGFKHVIPHLAQRFLKNENPFQVFGHDQTRAFNFIDDAVDGTILAMEKGRNGEIYHLGTDEEISIETLVRYTGELFGYDGEYQNAPTYPGSVARRCPDIAKAQRELGYRPQVTWKEGVKATIDWYRAYLERGSDLHESYYDK